MTDPQHPQQFAPDSQPASPQATNPGAPPAAPPTGAPPQVHYQTVDSRTKSPFLATLLSLMPGLEQVYVGYYQQGFINILVVGSLIVLLNLDIGDLTPLVGLFLAFFWLFNLVDANRRAGFYNRVLAGMAEAGLPDEMQMPDGGGGLVAGIFLIVFGLLSFAHIHLDFSLSWLADAWPLVLILMGSYLIYRSWAARQEEAEAH